MVGDGGTYRVADVDGNDTRTNDEAVGRWADEAATRRGGGTTGRRRGRMTLRQGGGVAGWRDDEVTGRHTGRGGVKTKSDQS